ncbi:MAG: PTS glucose transporter subunit IIA [Eubacterium sp.]|nr:PTS glucose transporter subunit IIA [Eubacterium sp.]
MNDTVTKIVQALGGEDNIEKAGNCITRLRVIVNDDRHISADTLEQIDGVMGVVHDRDNTLEIVVGPGKAKVFADELHEAGIGIRVHKSFSDNTKKENKRSIRDFLKIIGDIFVPMIPGIITAGLCAGFASLLAQVYPDYEKNSVWNIVYSVLTLVSTSFMTYITAWTGYRAAERFGATPILGGMLGMITSLDGINTIAGVFGLYNEKTPLNSVLCAGKGGVLAVIFGAFLLSVVEKRLRKHLPTSLDFILTPFVSLLICLLPYILLVMPVFGYISSGIAWGIGEICSSESMTVRLIGGYIASALFLPLVTTGMHHGLVGLYAIQLEEIGYITLYPVLAMAGAGQVGAALAIRRKAKHAGNEKLCHITSGALPAGFLGVGEPLIYGVTLPLGKPFITAGLGAGFGGAFVMAMQVASTTWGPSGLIGVFVMTAGPNGFVKNALSYLGGLLISYIGGYILTAFTIKEKDLLPEGTDTPEITHEDTFTFSGSPDGLTAPADGRIIKMEDIPDEVFANGTLGKCCGIMPDNGRIYAPCSGTIVTLADTGHAFAIEKESGENILVHIGIDTVSLNGDGFTLLAREGDEVTAGQCVIEADLAAIQKAGLSPIVITVCIDS